MNDIKTLRAYAKGRKLPVFKLLAIIPESWISYAYQVYSKTPISSDHAKEQRERDNILGITVEKYEYLTEYYNQLHPENLVISDAYNILDDAHSFRFGELKSKSTIPMHIDEPFSLRGLCVMSGQCKFVVETGDSVVMSPGELYFINGCYRHSVINDTDSTRIALLNKFTLTEENVRKLNELL